MKKVVGAPNGVDLSITSPHHPTFYATRLLRHSAASRQHRQLVRCHARGVVLSGESHRPQISVRLCAWDFTEFYRHTQDSPKTIAKRTCGP